MVDSWKKKKKKRVWKLLFEILYILWKKGVVVNFPVFGEKILSEWFSVRGIDLDSLDEYAVLF